MATHIFTIVMILMALYGLYSDILSVRYGATTKGQEKTHEKLDEAQERQSQNQEKNQESFSDIKKSIDELNKDSYSKLDIEKMESSSAKWLQKAEENWPDNNRLTLIRENDFKVDITFTGIRKYQKGYYIKSVMDIYDLKEKDSYKHIFSDFNIEDERIVEKCTDRFKVYIYIQDVQFDKIRVRAAIERIETNFSVYGIQFIGGGLGPCSAL